MVDELVVCNPGYLGKKLGPKNDLADATHLANELRCGHVVPVFHEQSGMMELRTLVSAYADVNRLIVMAKNRYKALFRSEALPTAGKKIYEEPERVKELSSSSGYKNAFIGSIVMQADKGLQFNVLKKVIYTAGVSDFVMFRLALLKKEEG